MTVIFLFSILFFFAVCSRNLLGRCYRLTECKDKPEGTLWPVPGQCCQKTAVKIKQKFRSETNTLVMHTVIKVSSLSLRLKFIKFASSADKMEPYYFQYTFLGITKSWGTQFFQVNLSLKEKEKVCRRGQFVTLPLEHTVGTWRKQICISSF